MKSIILFITIIFSVCMPALAQDFKTDMTNAKQSYSSGKLDEAHFALMQAMQELDIKVGQEILKLFPVKMDTMNANINEDRVAANSGYMGTTINRSYGINHSGDLSVMMNSPLIGTLNNFLNSPMMGGGMMSDGNTKVVKVQGYKAKMTKEDQGDGKTGYSIEIPLSNALITYRVSNCTDKQLLDMINTIPMPQLAKLIQ